MYCTPIQSCSVVAVPAPWYSLLQPQEEEIEEEGRVRYMYIYTYDTDV